MGFLQEYVGFEESPDFETKVNGIIDFWSNPCDAPWTVYLETLYPVLGRLFLALVEPDLTDIARSYLRPRGGLTRGHNRKKGRRRGNIPGIPDSADLYARLIPGATIWEGMEYGANTKFLWQIDGIIQRGLWYWLVIDLAADGFYWWAQGIQAEQFCSPTRRPGIFASNSSPHATAFFGQWFPSPGWSIHWLGSGFDWFISSMETPSGNIEFTYKADYVNTGSAWGEVGVRLTGAGPTCQGFVTVPPHETRTLTFSGTFRGGPIYALEQRVTGTPWVNGKDGTFSARKL